MFNTRISYRVCFTSQYPPYEPKEFPSPSMFRIYINPTDTPVLFSIINQLGSPSPPCLSSKQLITPLFLPSFLPLSRLTLYLHTEEIETHIPHPSYSNPSCSTSQQLKGDPRHRQAPSLLLSSLPSQPHTTNEPIPFHLISSHLTSSHSTPPHSRLLTHDIHIIKPRAAQAVARRSITLFR